MDKRNIVFFKIYPWSDEVPIRVETLEFKKGDWIIVKNESGQFESGIISSIKELDDNKIEDDEQYEFARVASLDDLKKIKEKNEKRHKILGECKDIVKKHKLPMKLVDCHFSFDGGKISFAFIADSRVDFRELVKDLTKYFQKTIRLQQIGSRDETKQLGQLGPCGRTICCKAFLDDLGNITTDLARLQNIEQRGSDRLSGVCGRLKCCLNYEAEGYEGCYKNLPEIGNKYKTKKGEKGVVVDWNAIRHSIDVKLEDGSIVKEYLSCGEIGCTGCKYKENNK